MAEQRWTIYLLSDPDDPRVGYVGQTRRSLDRRVRQHLTDAVRLGNRRSRWLRTIIHRGLEPLVESLQTCDALWKANDAEKGWIARCEKERGMVLTNTAPGGYFVFDEEGRKAALRRSLNQPDTKAKFSVASKKLWASRPKAERIEALLKGRTPETRQRQSEKMKAKWADPEWRATTLAKHRAAITSPEELARKSAVSRAVQNKPQVKEKRAEISKRMWSDADFKLRRKKYKEPCRCGRVVRTNGRCGACDSYFRRNGVDRPLSLEAIQGGVVRQASERSLLLWSDPEWRSRNVSAQRAAGKRRRKRRED